MNMLAYDMRTAQKSMPVATTTTAKKRSNDPFNEYRQLLFSVYELVQIVGQQYSMPQCTPQYERAGEQASEEAVSIEDMVETIKSTFGLNAQQVARLLNISRASLYNHIKQNSPRDFVQYKRLYKTAVKVQTAVPGGVASGLKNILVEGKTLLEHLRADYSNADRIVELATQVDQKLASNTGRQKALSIEQRRIRTHAYSRQG